MRKILIALTLMFALLPVSLQAQSSKLKGQGWYIYDSSGGHDGNGGITSGPFKDEASCKSDPNYKFNLCIYDDGKPLKPKVPHKRAFKTPGWYRVAVKDSSIVDGPYEIESYCATFPEETDYIDYNYKCKFVEKEP